MDHYFKKEITYKFTNHVFKFDIANTLFSTFDLDHGSDILIRAIIPSAPKSILDIGCGYGPLGIMLAKVNPQAEALMVDRDLLAVWQEVVIDKLSHIRCKDDDSPQEWGKIFML